MKNYCILFGFILSLSLGFAQEKKSPPTLADRIANMEAHEGFVDFYYEAKSGKIWLLVDQLDQEILYINSLPAGVGSNDIGLDRGQLGGTRIVKFVRSGPKVMLVQPNYDFRAVSDNIEEQLSVEQAFAQSVLWGFKVEAEEDGKLLLDATKFLLRDAHGVIPRLQRSNQGSYRLDESRSAIYLPRTKNFPKNTEFEATITFAGQAKGAWIRSVVPSPNSVTVRMHHSFIELPDDNYTPREFDPRMGFNGISYQDYATPIGSPLMKRFISRHRLQKKNPNKKVSEAVEPIVYYLDRGTPEPIRSALLDGARWWAEAFEAAGFKDAYRVEILPADADPMDARYNLIQWIHRSTRGWSYGSSIRDPRTGEIIKGQVSLGSLRVRQDFLIAQGLIKPYETGKPASPKMLELALARLRQLSAHEVGHTLGMSHNFAASTNDRASVMDYPHPYIQMKNGKIDFSEAYDVGIGEWDTYSIRLGYTEFKAGKEKEGLEDICQEYLQKGIRFISDQDARPQGSAHAHAHLWDNGNDITAEFERMLEVRKTALANFSETNIPVGRPLAELEEVLVPVYFAHRYQVEAVSKLVAGMDYSYAVRGDGQRPVDMVPASIQRKAINSIIASLGSEVLTIPEHILNLVPPRALAYRRGRENFKTRTGAALDPLSAAEAMVDHTLGLFLHPHRANRLVEFHARNIDMPGLNETLDSLLSNTLMRGHREDLQGEVSRVVDRLVIKHLMNLAVNKQSASQTQALAAYKIRQVEAYLDESQSSGTNQQAHEAMVLYLIDQFLDEPAEFEIPVSLSMPDGSPIGSMGCGHMGH